MLALPTLHNRRLPWAVSVAVFGAALLSLAMETLQSYLPSRIPSNVDLVLNMLGAGLGACCAWALEKSGIVDRWSRFRARWFAQDARGALVLLLLWPLALLFPAAVPLGLGQVFERLESALADALTDTPFLEWLPVRELELQPLVPIAELLCVALGALIPCLLGYCVIRMLWQRAAFSVAILSAGIAASALSAALSYGPEHAWAWLDLPVQVGLGLAVVLAILFLVLPRRSARRAGLAGADDSSRAAQPGACRSLLCPDIANLGAGALHPFSWCGAVAGLDLALCRFVVCAGAAFRRERSVQAKP